MFSVTTESSGSMSDVNLSQIDGAIYRHRQKTITGFINTRQTTHTCASMHNVPVSVLQTSERCTSGTLLPVLDTQLLQVQAEEMSCIHDLQKQILLNSEMWK